jgi:UDP-N-acetylglucosamine transferase subunit ALG13
MVFLTVGNSDPFDRLVQAFDEWVRVSQQESLQEVVAQIGYGRYIPKNCPHVRFMPPVEYRRTFEQAKFVVAHAGMGTIITAVEFKKTLIVMPKRASLGEQRNEHQLATVRQFRHLPYLQVVNSEFELFQTLNSAVSGINTIAPIQGGLCTANEFQPSPSLINFVNKFVHQ